MEQPQINTYHNRIFGLDLLRAVAILLVVYTHGYGLIYQTIPQTIYFVPVLDGVTMFFVLSGFLIGRILLRTITQDDFNGKMLVDFWVRRWFRTLPNYMLVLTVLIMASYLSGSALPDNAIQYFFFSQNIASPHPDFFREAWSLSVEEWFYLIIPIPIYLSTKLLPKIDRRKLMLLWIAVVIFSVTAFRCYRAYHYGYSSPDEWELALRKQVVTRLDSLMFGVLGAYVSLYKKDFWHAFANKGFVLGLCCLLFYKVYYYGTYSIFYLNYFHLTLTSVGTLLLIPKLSSMKCETRIVVSVITFISLISYSMYLLHFTPVQEYILPAVMGMLTDFHWLFDKYINLIRYVVYWAITLIGSFLLYYYFERPMTALRDKFHPRVKSTVTAFADREAQ